MKTGWKLTQLRRAVFSVVLLSLSGCQTTPPTPAGVALNTLCREWGGSLVYWHDDDTLGTKLQVTNSNRKYQAACKPFINTDR